MELQSHLEEIEGLGAQVLVVANDDPAKMAAFRGANGLRFPMLADPGGKVIESYGIRNQKVTDRVLPDPTALVLDREGKVRYKRIDVDYTVRPPAEELVKALRALKGS